MIRRVPRIKLRPAGCSTFQVVGIDGKFVIFITNPQVTQPSTAALARLRFPQWNQYRKRGASSQPAIGYRPEL
jgi:hypothetical protein